MNFLGVQALISVTSHIFFVLLTFWALRALNTENWIRKNYISQARLLYLFLSIAIGYNVSSFFIEFILTSQNLIFLLD